MKKLLVRLVTAIKAALHLGFFQVFWYVIYQAGLRSGIFRQLSPVSAYFPSNTRLVTPFRRPEASQILTMFADNAELAQDCLREADEICAGQARLFGGPPAPLLLESRLFNRHWTAYEGRPQAAGVEDFKFIWESARFGWVYPLGRAYLFSRDERYPEAFWRHFHTFCASNPPNQGPNWSSAQEVALRLLALVFAAFIFDLSIHTSHERRTLLAGVIEAHARRIPLTLSYASAQNNNHLISEALGLFAAGSVLPDHPDSARWRKMGQDMTNHALVHQIKPDGVYVQHSTNYHRLMLQEALLSMLFGARLSTAAHQRLAAAATWLLALTDPVSGRAPNLGANDGAYIFPLAPGGFADFRPTGQAAARALLGGPVFPPGPWDEMALWLGQDISNPALSARPAPTNPAVIRLGDATSWATLRAARFRERPSHADQLHVDLWWQGENIAMDAGTFRYTAAPPWDNAFAETLVHNTVTVNRQNQMQRASRFLWLDWAQARVLNTRRFQVEMRAAQHNGYQHLGILHRRVLKRIDPNHWQVADYLLPGRTFRLDLHRAAARPCTLHWLLPDWPWQLSGSELVLTHSSGKRISLTLSIPLSPGGQRPTPVVSLVRAGTALAGPQIVPAILGWYSPTYGQKIPALSFSFTFHAAAPVTVFSDWVLFDPHGIREEH